ncbi:MAG TPA: YbjQ family protein [Gemmatimonadetes bacterium]|nr:YbjQ family protein [Gemmatimonadota bacterium]
MILATTSQISGMRTVKTLGIARGNTIRARHIGKDIMASLRNLAGGEIHEYTKLLAESREQALARLIDDASDLGANAVVGVRFQTSLIQSGASEMLCYGTAVQVELDRGS